MSDSDGSSDPEDFEYVPEGDGDGGKSESEESVGGEEEEERGVSTSTMTTRSSQRTQSQSTSTSGTRRSSRRHRKPVREMKGGEEGEEGEEEEKKEQREKERVDDLWESFKQDSAARLKKPLEEAPGPIISSKEKDPNAEAAARTVKVRKTYDFAGDEVVVEQEVAADSVEAQQSVSDHHREPLTTASVSKPGLPSPVSSDATATGARPSPTSAASGPALAGKKRSGISSVLQSLTKKPKMSTLEKSQLDWNRFKAEEGLEHELAQRRKDGYLERQEFLQRTDWRQYELEREERLKKFNRPH